MLRINYSSCLLACLLTYWLFISKAHILHDNAIDLNPTQYLNITTLLFICWKCSTVWIIRLIWAFVLKSYRFETISQWVNNIRIVIFGRSFPLEDIEYLLRGACIVFPTVRHTILTTHENHPIWKPPMIWISFFLSFFLSFYFPFLFFLQSQKI